MLSSHELALGYEEVTTNSIYVTFPLADDPSRQLLVWTTTPWTLLSNVAVAVHPELEYGRVPGRGPADHPRHRAGRAAQRAGEGRAQLRRARRRAHLPGRELVGLRYHRPLELVALPDDRASRVVVPGGFVSAEDGSGLVHMAPAFGADDYQAGIEHRLALVRPVAADGTFVGTGWPEIEGRLVTAKETNDLIIQRLKQDGRWHLTQPHTHTYPHCWRCSSPLIYYARDSWFVRTSAVKERMLELNRQVAWHPPEVGAGRFGEWLENNVDWALSRDRYWGTPLPVWVCDRDPSHVEVVGSYARLAERWGKPLPADFDPHKPFIDGYTWPCECGGTRRRTAEVIDTWFDSGAMPYAQWHYPFEHEAEFRAHFPADFICEGVDQTRGWFYSLLAIAVTAFDAPAYRHVVVNELVLDADGQKMSKSRGNVVSPWDMIEEFGADTVRLYLLASSQVWLPKRFDRAAIPEVAGKFLNALRSTYEFFQLYAPDAGQGAPPAGGAPAARPLDPGPARRHGRGGPRAWGGYDPTAGVRAIMDFVVQDLSRWYVRAEPLAVLGARRGRRPGGGGHAARGPDHRGAAARPGGALRGRLAPPRPGGNLGAPRPVSGDPRPSAPRAGGGMDAVRRLASLAHHARQQARIGARQPLARMQVAVPPSARGAGFDALLELLRQEVNVKTVDVVASDTDLVRLRAKANFRSLGKRYGKRTPAVAAAAGPARRGPAARAGAGPAGRAGPRGRAGELSARGRGGRARGRQRLAGGQRRPLRRGARSRRSPSRSATREWRARWSTGSSGCGRKRATSIPTGSRSGSRARARWPRPCGRTPISSRARRWRGASTIGSRAPAPDLEQQVDIDGHDVVVGVQRHPDGRNGAGPQPRNGE